MMVSQEEKDIRSPHPLYRRSREDVARTLLGIIDELRSRNNNCTRNSPCTCCLRRLTEENLQGDDVDLSRLTVQTCEFEECDGAE